MWRNAITELLLPNFERQSHCGITFAAIVKKIP
jgi:hypothetical protein